MVSLPVLPRVVRVGGLIAVVSVIVYFSLLDTPTPPSGPPGPFWDKQLHFVAYGALTVATAQATIEYRDLGWTRVLGVVAFAFAFGVGIELVQWPLAERYASVGDAAANAIGIALASVVFWVESLFGYGDWFAGSLEA